MSSNNVKLFLSAAGSGKTKHIIDSALSTKNCSVLITTFTDNNTREIKNRIISAHVECSSSINVLPWFTFLLRDAVRPYQGFKVTARIRGLDFVSGGRSATRWVNGRFSQRAESDIRFYLNKSNMIYSDKLSMFACKVDEMAEGLVVDRIARLYDYIFIDEVQDLNGYDLEFLHKLAKSCKNLIMAGDVRQVAYNTHIDPLYKKYANGEIREFFKNEVKDVNIVIDTTKLSGSYRCCEKICQVSNQLFPHLPPSKSNKIVADCETHCGVYYVRKKNIKSYVDEFHPQELRYSVRTEVVNKAYTFGDSKGMGFKRVVIYPTDDYLQWLNNKSATIKPASRHKLYIAITRAEISVAFVVPDNFNLVNNHLQIEEWIPGLFG